MPNIGYALEHWQIWINKHIDPKIRCHIVEEYAFGDNRYYTFEGLGKYAFSERLVYYIQGGMLDIILRYRDFRDNLSLNKEKETQKTKSQTPHIFSLSNREVNSIFIILALNLVAGVLFLKENPFHLKLSVESVSIKISIPIIRV